MWPRALKTLRHTLMSSVITLRLWTMNASCREAALGMTVWYTLGYFRRNLSTLAHEHWNVSNGTNYTTYSIMLQRKEKCCLLSLVAYNNYLSTFPLILQWNRVNGELKHKKVSFFFFFWSSFIHMVRLFLSAMPKIWTAMTNVFYTFPVAGAGWKS